MDSREWFWIMNYCKKNCLPPAQAWAWEKAKKDYISYNVKEKDIMRMRFEGCSDEQVRWGNNDDPREYMSVGDIVTLMDKDVHSWHTKLIFEEYPDKKFNSVCFEPV